MKIHLFILTQLFLSLVLYQNTFSQNNNDIEIALEFTKENATNYPTELLDSVTSSKYKIPKGIETWIIKYFDFERNIPYSLGNKKIYFFIGSSPDKTNLVILDANHDGDFTNDKAYYSSNVKENTKYNPIVYHIDEVKSVQLYLDTELKNRKYSTSIENALPLQVSFLHRIYKFYDEKKQTYVKIQNSTRIPFLPIDQKKDGIYVDGVMHKYNDTLSIFGKSYTISQVSKYGDTLRLHLNKDSVNHGFSEGQNVRYFGFTEFGTNKKMFLDSIGKEFILLDFWGTWCAPCIEGIPDLKKLYEENGAILQIVSICSDDARNIQKLEKIIREQNMSWIHVFDDYSIENSIVNKFHVSAFPTFILINKDGRIISRGDGMSIDKIREILKAEVH